VTLTAWSSSPLSQPQMFQLSDAMIDSYGKEVCVMAYSRIREVVYTMIHEGGIYVDIYHNIKPDLYHCK
jgi:hypothetical protein